MKRLYFDYNATTPMAPSVGKLLKEAIDLDLKNPSSIHYEGRLARSKMEEARSRISLCLGCQPDELYFTSGATESNNLLFQSVWSARPTTRNKIITTCVEHDSVLKPLKELEKKGAKVVLLNVDRHGNLNQSQIEKEFNEEVLLVSVMLANNETGILFPIQELAKKARTIGAYFHTDAANAVGKYNICFSELCIDMLSYSSHKAYGPKGTGALLVRTGIVLDSILLGGLQEKGFRAGTQNILGILGMAEALHFATSNLDEETKRLFSLRDRIKNALHQLNSKIIFHESKTSQLPGTLNVSFPEISGQTLLARLDLEGVAASYGSACHSGALEISRVLLAMGIPEAEAIGSIRLSFGRMTTDKDVEDLICILNQIIE